MVVMNKFSTGGQIQIKPENKGKFTKWAKSQDMSTAQAANTVTSNPGEFSPGVRKMATFAKNARGWKKEAGGVVTDPKTDPVPKNKNKVSKDLAYAYTQKQNVLTPLVDVEENDPVIYDQKEFVDYYRNKALKVFTPEDRAIYDEYVKKKDMDSADSFITLRGGLPDFNVYQKIVRDYERTQIKNPTDWSKIDYMGSTTGGDGYRYNAINSLFSGDRGKPAKGSITTRKKGGKMSVEDIANCF